MRLARCLLVVTGAVTVGACGDEPPSAATDVPSLPARWEGRLPCPDCPDIETTVVLRPDSVFLYASVYPGGAAEAGGGIHGDIGRWRLDEGRLVLRGGTGGLRYFDLLPSRRLRLLDAGGRPIESERPYELRPVPGSADTLAVAVPVLGEYLYLADAAVLTECASGLRLPVASGEVAAEMERAYLDARSGPGAPALVEVRARPAPRRGMEGNVREQWVVEGVRSPLRPERRCPEPTSPADPGR